MEAKHPVKSIKTAFEIVQYLQDNDGARISELAEEIDKSKSSIHNHLDTLHELGYVTKSSNQYEIGLRFLDHGIYARDRRPLYEVAKPELEKIADETGQAVNLLVEEHGKGIYLARALGENAVSVDDRIGRQVYLHATALGKAILAFSPDDKVDWILNQHGLPKRTESTITDKDELVTELETIRKRGVAFDDEERLTGTQCVAVPILTDDEHPLGAISVSIPTRRMDDDPFDGHLPDRLKDAANVIRLNRTYS
jgi:DNA-binding IclR family transcriptional regulator